MAVDFTIDGLEQLQRDISEVAARYPDQLNVRMKQVGKEFTKDCNSQMPPEYKKGKSPIPKSWKVEVDQVRHVVNQTYIKNTAPHFHLVENGHRKFDFHGNDTGGFVPGKHYVEQTVEQYEDKFPEAVEEFLDQMLRNGGLL